MSRNTRIDEILSGRPVRSVIEADAPTPDDLSDWSDKRRVAKPMAPSGSSAPTADDLSDWDDKKQVAKPAAAGSGGSTAPSPERVKALSMLVRNIISLGANVGYTIGSMENNPKALPAEQQTPEARREASAIIQSVKQAADSFPLAMINDTGKLARNASAILKWVKGFLEFADPRVKKFNFRWGSYPNLSKLHKEITGS